MLITKTIKLSYDRYILLELMDARSIRVTSNCAFMQPTYNENMEIASVNFSNQAEIKINDLFNFPVGSEWNMNFDFKVNQIKKFDNYFILYSSKRTKSSYFLMPCLGYNKEYFKWNEFFVNAYAFNEKYHNNNIYIYLLYKYMPLTQYSEFEKLNIKLNTFVELLQPKYSNEVVFVHKLNNKYKDDYLLFTQGLYSKLNDKLKRQILFFHNSNKDSELGQILFKDEKRRKQLEMEFLTDIPVELELWDKPNMEEETLKLD